MKITFYGHSSFGIHAGGKFILIDPYIFENPKASHININELKPDYVFLTHVHFDHFTDVAYILQNNPSTIVVSNYEVATYLSNKGFKSHPMNLGGTWKFDFGTVKMVNAVHSSSFPDGSYGGNPVGFVIEGEHKNIYIAGDTALTMDMKLIPLRTKLDLAILPIGSNFTMDVEDAILASDFIECDKILGCHYDTFGYIEINHEEAIRKFFNKGKDLMLLEIGQSIEL